MYKAIIFDLDGTLINSLEDIGDSMNTVLKRSNFPTHDLQTYKVFVGNGIRNLVRLALPENKRDDATISRCFDAMVQEYREHCLDKTKSYDGIDELLKELQRRNIRLSVLSNKAHELTEKVVTNLFPKVKFDMILGSSADIPRKPNPYGANLIVNKLQIEPKNFLYIGDTGIDMQTADNIGVFSIGVLWGFRSAQELKNGGAKVLIHHPSEILDFF